MMNAAAFRSPMMSGYNPAALGANPLAAAGMGGNALGLPADAFTGDGVNGLLAQANALASSTLAMFGGSTKAMDAYAAQLMMQKQQEQQLTSMLSELA